METSEAPKLSAVVVTPAGFEHIRRTLAHLGKQTICNQLEVVIVAPSANALGAVVPELSDFLGYQIVEVGEIASTGEAVAAGVNRATARVVVYAEEHSYPDPGWAEALVKAHRQPWAAVGAVIGNANPESIVSWAQLYTDFGNWLEPATGGETSNLAWHHTAYKRAVLLEYGSALGAMLETEGILHRDLRKKGHRLYFEAGARSDHLNVSVLASYVGAQFHGGRLFGAARARYGSWTIWRRIIYIGGFPLIPLVRARRVLSEIRRTARGRALMPRILPAVALGLFVHALAEATGYAFGPGRSTKRRLSYELNRHLHLAVPAGRNGG